MNKTKKIAFGIGILLAVLAVLTVPAVADNVFYLVPRDSEGAPGEEISVSVMLNASDVTDAFDAEIWFDLDVVNITAWENPETGFWMWWDVGHHGNYIHAGGMNFAGGKSGLIGLANLTLKGNNSGISQLHFNPTYTGCGFQGNPLPETLIDGTFTCPIMSNISLPMGWNLISLPLEPLPGNESVDEVLGTVYYDSVQRYDGTTFVPVTTMEPGVGYFVHVAFPSIWTYKGTPYKQMNIALEYGLNMVGWLNCTKPIDETSLDNSSLVYYITRWNTTAQEYNEVYNPAAPPPFHDFDTMDRGRGYWISAKTAFTLTENCSA